MKKIFAFTICLTLLCASLCGCNTSKKAEKDEPVPEATTAVKGSIKYKPDLFAKDILKINGYDITKVVTLPVNYENLKIDLKGEGEFSEEGFAQFAKETLASVPEYKKLEKTVIEEGDVVEIDYTETSDTKGEEQKGVKITVGHHDFGTDFDSKLIGKKVGQTFLETAVYPDDFAEEFAGKEVTYTGKINGIYESVPVTLDNITDDYVKKYYKDIYRCSTVSEFKKALKSEYENKLEYDRTSLAQNKVLEELVRKSTFHISKKMEQAEVKRQIQIQKKTAEGEGVSYEDYLKDQLGLDEKTLEKQIKDSFKSRLVVDAMIQDQNFGISTTEFKESMSVYLSYGYASLDDVYEVFGGKEEMILTFAENKMLEKFANSVCQVTK